MATFIWPAWASWMLLGLLAFQDLSKLRALPPLKLHCVLPTRSHVDSPCEILYKVSGAAPTLRVELLDEFPEELGGDCRLSWFPGQQGQEQGRLTPTPRRRGLLKLGLCRLSCRSPLALWTRRHSPSLTRQLAVLPKNTWPRRHGMRSRHAAQLLGLKPRRPRGEGNEFEALRDYTLDDEPRKIDWRASARRRSLVVRDFHVEQNQTVIVAVDCGRLMGTLIAGQSKLDHALSAALCLVRASSGGGDRVGFVAFDSEVRAWVSARRPQLALGAFQEATLPLNARPEEANFGALSQVMRQRQSKRTLLIILTDFVEEGASAQLRSHLASLSRRHCVLLVGLRDRLLMQLEQPAPQLHMQQLYERLVLQDLAHARQVTLTRIARSGVHTLDLDPGAITAPLLDRYLAIRAAGLV